MKRRHRLALTVLAGGVVLAVAGLVLVLPSVREEHLRRALWADLVPPEHPDDEWRARRDAAVEALVGDEARLRWALDRLVRTDPPIVNPRWTDDTYLSECTTHESMLEDRRVLLRHDRRASQTPAHPVPGFEVDGRRQLALRAWDLDEVPQAALTDVLRWLVQTRLDWGTVLLPGPADYEGRPLPPEVEAVSGGMASLAPYDGMPPEPGPAPRRRAPGGRMEARLEIIAWHPPGVRPLPEGDALEPRVVWITSVTTDDIWATRWSLILSRDACERAEPLRLEWTRGWKRAPRWMVYPDVNKMSIVRAMFESDDVPPGPALPAATDLPSLHPDWRRPADLHGDAPPPPAPAPRCVTPDDHDWRLQDHLIMEADGAVLRLRGDLPHPAVLHVTAHERTDDASPWANQLVDRWVSLPAGPVDMVLGHVDPSRPDWGATDPREVEVGRWEVEAVRDVGIAAVDGGTVWCDDRAEIVVREERDPDRDD